MPTQLPLAQPASVNRTLLNQLICVSAGVLAFLLLLILGFQIHGLFRNYAYYITTGSESLPIYSIWQVQEGMPLYQWPFKDNFQLTLYNFGFYHTYAFVLNLLHARGPEILLYGRLLTTLLSLAGVIVQARLLHWLIGRPAQRLDAAAVWLISFCTWFNSYMPGYYDLSVRPDVLAVVLCTLATLCFLHHVRERRWSWLLAAALAWTLGWCVKQSCIFSLIGCGFYLLLFRQWKSLSILTLGYGLATGFMLFLNSPEYRWNLLAAPRVQPLIPSIGVPVLLLGTALSLFGWSAVVTLPLLARVEGSKEPADRLRSLLDRMRPGGDLSVIVVLASIMVVGGALAAVTLCRKGASLNYMFEVFVAASSLSYILFVRLSALYEGRAARRLAFWAGGLVLSMCLFPVAQLAMHRIGPMARATREDASEKRDFARFLAGLPRPLLITDEIWNLPWFASDMHTPVVKLDPIWYPDAVAKGLIENGGLEGRIQHHGYKSIYVEKNSPLYQVAVNAGYHPVPIPDPFTRFKDSLGHRITNCVLLNLPPL